MHKGNKVRKVILTSNLFLPNVGGIENSILSLGKIGLKEGDDIKVITSDIVENGSNVKIAHEKINGIDVFRYFTDGKWGLKYFNHIWNAVKLYKSHFDKEAILVARSHWSVVFAYLGGFRNIYYIVPGVVKNQNKKAPIFFSLSNFRYHLQCFLQKKSLQLTKENIVFSDNMKEQIEQIGVSNTIRVLKPGVDLNRFELKVKNNCRECKLLTVSRLYKVKGLEYAINALVYLPEHYSLTIVGDGPEKEQLINIAKEKKVYHRVCFLGKVTEPERIYKEHDVFLLPSLYEPFGQTILEASASGIPTVAFDSNFTNVETASSVILGKMGFYAQELTAKSFSNAIIQASEEMNNNKLLANKLRKVMEENYSWGELYHNVIK